MNFSIALIKGLLYYYVHFISLPAGSRSCGQEPLITLKNRPQAKNIASTCYDVYGYPINNSTSLEQLTGCTARIITSIQEGMYKLLSYRVNLIVIRA